MSVANELKAVIAFLVDTWAGEDPYRSFDHPVDRARSDCRRDLTVAAKVVTAWDGTRPVGAVLISHDRRTDGPMLDWLTVAADQRELGIATALLGHVIELLAVDGFRHLTRSVSVANIESLRWHLSRGFTPIERPRGP